MMLMAAATDLLVIFLALEVLSLSVYVLTGLRRASAAGAEAAFKYFLLGAFSSAFFLYGIAFAFAVSGSTRLEQLGVALSAQGAGAPSTMALLAVGLLAVGFAFKVSAVPFHMWTPDAYEGAPTIVTAFMSTGVKAAAFAAFVRVFLSPLEPLQGRVDPGALGVIAGGDDDPRHGGRRGADQRQADARVFEHRARRLPAARHHRDDATPARRRCSSTCCPTRSRTSARSASSRCSARRSTSTTSCATSPACGSRVPAWPALMTVFLLSLGGFPPTAGFIGKWYIFAAAVQRGHYWLAIIGVLTSVVSVFFYLRIVVMMYMTEGSDTRAPARAGRRPSPAWRWRRWRCSTSASCRPGSSTSRSTRSRRSSDDGCRHGLRPSSCRSASARAWTAPNTPRRPDSTRQQMPSCGRAARCVRSRTTRSCSMRAMTGGDRRGAAPRPAGRAFRLPRSRQRAARRQRRARRAAAADGRVARRRASRAHAGDASRAASAAARRAIASTREPDHRRDRHRLACARPAANSPSVASSAA